MFKMDYNEIITTDYRILQSLSKEEKYDIVTEIINHYRKAGFPYFNIDKEKIKKEYISLCKSDWRKLELENNELQQSMVGLATCNMFHPEMYSVRCNNSKSPMDIFLDDDLFRVALTKRIEYNDRNLNDSCVRRTLSAFGGQAVSNFRPSIARWVYAKYGNGGDVLDPCAGYGGRLMGAVCSSISSYTGIDPNCESVAGNQQLNIYLAKVSGEIKDTILFCMPFEDYSTQKQYDLVFTSPPYFDTEKYSNDKTQSWVRYPTYSDWVSHFLYPLIKNSFNMIKYGGYLALNVGKPIDEGTYKIGTEIFGNEPITYKMRLSKFLGKGNKDSVSHKIEPIFIWKKE